MGRFVWCDIGMYVCSSAAVAVQSNTLVLAVLALKEPN